MKTGIKFEDLNRGDVRPSFYDKLKKSVELLRKTEKLALRYDPDNGFNLGFSGGKDSQALYHVAELAGVRYYAFMSLTSVDPPQVIRFVKINYPEVDRIKPYKSIFDIALDKGVIPTMRMRWCCAELKENAKPNTVTLTGVRREESSRRAGRKDVEVSGHKFSGSFDEFQNYQTETIKKKMPKNMNFDQFSIDEETTIRCIGGKDNIIVSPLLEWTERDVWYFLNDVLKIPHCELYDAPYNQRRIGCILCPMNSNRKMKEQQIKLWPHVKHRWIETIKEIRRRGGATRRQTEFYEFFRQASQQSLCRSRTCLEIRLDSEQSLQEGILECGQRTGFLDKPSSVNRGGQNADDEEDKIAELIFDWWISSKSYKEWFADKFLQQKIDFGDSEESQED